MNQIYNKLYALVMLASAVFAAAVLIDACSTLGTTQEAESDTASIEALSMWYEQNYDEKPWETCKQDRK